MKISVKSLMSAVMACACVSAAAISDNTRAGADYTRIFTSDNGDGTYSNPVVYGDFPDADVIRVGDTFYMLSTSMFYMPGATILRSYDLVNWEYCCNPIDFIENDDAYNLKGGKHRYSHGQWASALQFNPKDETFYLLYNTLDDGAYLMTASDIEGPWTKRKLNHAFYDCGVLFDGDDIYVVRGNTEIWIDRVDKDFRVIESKKIHTGPSDNAIEGSRLYHIGSYYYVYCTYSGWPGKQTCLRSTSVFGTYEEKIVFDDSAVHQGALVETENGAWWTIMHRDMWPWGRVPYLLPVKFTNGWPVVGNNGKLASSFTKPVVKSDRQPAKIETNDAFRHYELGRQWQWNHNPDDLKWSLTERPGYMRLYTANITTDIWQARNTLTQRMLGYTKDMANSYGTFALDLSHMKEGDCTGIATMQDPMAYAGVRIVNGHKRLFYATTSLTGKITNTQRDIATITSDKIYLRGIASFNSPGIINFYYSTDNQTYHKFGDTWTMQYDLTVFVGNRWGIFNYATKSLGGYVDIDWFSTEPVYSEDRFLGSDFQGYSPDHLTIDRLEPSVSELTMLTGTSVSPDIFAVYRDGRRVNATLSATYASSAPDIVSVDNGRITAVSDGDARVTVTCKDQAGNTINTVISVTASSFPLTNEYFNPSIWTTGSFDETTGATTTGEYGFAGWHYDNGLDLSDYKYLVAKVRQPDYSWGFSLRVFDTNSYWTSPAVTEKKTAPNGQEYFVVDLHNSMAEDNSHKIDPSHIYFVGFWNGRTQFFIDAVYVTNDDDYLNQKSGVEIITTDHDKAVDIYNLQGMPVQKGITPAEAREILPPGIYIIGNRKVFISK